MKRLLSALAEQHSQFTQRNEHQCRAQFVQQPFRDEHEIGVRERMGVFSFIRQVRELKRLLAVRRDERKVAQIQMMHRLRVEAQPHPALAAERLDFVQQRLRDHALAVIAHDDGIAFRQSRFQFREQTGGEARIQAVARLAVHAHDLLFLGDDARLDAGMASAGDEQSVAADLLFAEQPLQMTAGAVIADRAEKFRRGLEGNQVARHVRRAAGHEAFAHKIHHWHRRFRRDARHAAPDELVEHHVAQHKDAGLLRSGQNLPGARSGQFLRVHFILATDETQIEHR